MIKVIAVVLMAISVSACGAVYSWDTMQLRSVQKQAAQKIMDQCNAGDMDACAYLAGSSSITR